MANLMLSVIGAVAQFERDLIRERQIEGIELRQAGGEYDSLTFRFFQNRWHGLKFDVIVRFD